MPPTLGPECLGALAEALSGSRITIAAQDRELRYRWMLNPPPELDGIEVIGVDERGIMASSIAERLEEPKRRAIATGEPVFAEVDLDAEPVLGTRVWDLDIRPMRDESGGVEGILTVAVDVTDRVLAERAARDAESTMGAIVQHAVDGIAVADEDGRVCVWNPEMERITGVPRAEALGTPLTERFAEVMSAYSPSEIEEAIEDITRRIQPADASGQAFIERVFTSRSGDRRRVLTTDFSTVTSGGRVFGGIVRDVTAARAAEEEYEENRRFTQAVLDQTPAVVYTYDLTTDGALYLNQRIAEILGYTPEELCRDGVGADLVHPADAQAASEYFAAMREAADDSSRDLEVRMRDAAGRWRWLHTRSRPLTRDADGRVAQIVGVAEDITKRKGSDAALALARANLEELVAERTAELAAANRAKDTFMANMSHELRTPLNSVIGFSDILLQGLAGPLNREQHTQIEMVNQAGRHLLEVVNDVLDLSRIERGRMSVVPEPFELGGLLHTTVETLRPLAEAAGIEIVCAECDVPIEVVTDRRRMQQILTNLVGNALKFTPSGRVSVGGECRGDDVIVRVADTGVGIAEEDLPRVFDEFSQFEMPGGVKPAGAGLGLHISKRLATLLGGRIEVESTVGAGSTFTLVLPRHLLG